MNPPPLGEAISLVKNKYENDISKVCIENKWEEATCFFEFYGPNSFAGRHEKENHTVTLFDVNPYKDGILNPHEFLKYFGHLETPHVLYLGKITEDFINSVKDSTLPGISFEGVVCKGANDKKTKMPIMFKIKTKAWLNKLKTYCKDDISLFETLS